MDTYHDGSLMGLLAVTSQLVFALEPFLRKLGPSAYLWSFTRYPRPARMCLLAHDFQKNEPFGPSEPEPNVSHRE